MSGGGGGSSIRYKFLEKDISPKCLMTLLGIGPGRLRKGAHVTPDLRFGKAKTGSREATYSVDGFLTVLYDQLAETLPDRYLRVQNMVDCFLNWFCGMFNHPEIPPVMMIMMVVTAL